METTAFLVSLYFVFSFLTDFVGILTGDDNVTVYADGCLVGRNGDSLDDSKWFSFSGKTPSLIAVSVENDPKNESGFLGIFSNGVVTDSSWKCKETDNPENGWEQINFADDAWPQASVRSSNSEIKVYGVPLKVHWISPENHFAKRFICRRYFNVPGGTSVASNSGRCHSMLQYVITYINNDIHTLHRFNF